MSVKRTMPAAYRFHIGRVITFYDSMYIVVGSTIKLYSLSQCSGSVSEIPTFLLHDSDTMSPYIRPRVVISCIHLFKVSISDRFYKC